MIVHLRSTTFWGFYHIKYMYVGCFDLHDLHAIAQVMPWARILGASDGSNLSQIPQK